MKLDELLLTAFGRFHGERIVLSPGLNIIYGENEAGKTTVQSFIMGMLYGFKKRGQRREYTEAAERYRPWTGADYRGTLSYTLDAGRSYRVERLFEPGRDMARIYDAVTGADLTGQFAQDRRKELLFAEAHLGLDEAAFRSTAWVGQLAVGNLEAGRELVGRVANLQESGREDLSVKGALAWLEEQARAIGTERAATRPYGRAVRALAEKRQEMERSEAVHGEMRGWEGQLIELKAVLAELDGEVAACTAELDWALLREAESRLERVEAGSQRIRELQAQAEALRAYADVPSAELPRLQQLLHEADQAAAAAEAWGERVAALTAALDEEPVDAGMRTYGLEAARALEAAEAAERGARARSAVLEASAGAISDGLATLEADLRGLKPGGGAGGWAWVAVAVLALAGAVAAVAFGQTMAGVGLGVLAAAAVGLWMYSRQQVQSQVLRYEQLAARRDGQRAQLANLQAELAAVQAEVAERQAEARRQIALAAGPGADAAAFRRAWAGARASQERLGALEGDLSDARRRAGAEGDRAARAAASAAAIARAAGVSDAAAFVAACARREAREKAIAEARALEGALGALLGGATLETLAADLARCRAKVVDTGAPPQATRPVETLRDELAQLEARRADLSVKAGEIGARLDAALKEAPDPAALRRELEALQEEKAGYDAELAALELAGATIAEVAGEIHREFAPRLNEAMGRAAAAVSGGRYSAVQVDEEAAIRVRTDDDRTVALTALSGGTADQLHLGLRLALLDLITDGQESVPLFLDDPFVQYDDRRAAAAMACLAEVAQGRQVILMTCHRREQALARQTGAPCRFIALGDAAAEE